jgi:hypothetical protein
MENFQEAKHFVCSSLSYVFFGIFSRKDNFCLEMLKSVAIVLDPRHCVPSLVVWCGGIFPKKTEQDIKKATSFINFLLRDSAAF